MKVLLDYVEQDRPWGEWLTWTVTELGHVATNLPDELLPGSSRPQVLNHVLQDAEVIIPIISDAYTSREDPILLNAAVSLKHEAAIVLPLVFSHCALPPVVAPLIPLDLTELNESQAKATLSLCFNRIARTKRSGTPRASLLAPPFPQVDLPAPTRSLLPIPSDEHPDVTDLLIESVVGTPGPAIHLILGPEESGKSTLLRVLANNASRTGASSSVVEAKDGVPLVGSQFLLLDHLERLEADDPRSEAYEILTDALPRYLHGTNGVAVLCVSESWANSFQAAWHMSIQACLGANVATGIPTVWRLRPYTADELNGVCDALELPATWFDRDDLRLPGVLAMARSQTLQSEATSRFSLRAQGAQKWMQRARTRGARKRRRSIWERAGKASLLTGDWSAPAPAGNYDLAPSSRVSSLVSDSPFVIRGGRMIFQSPAWADVAMAEQLIRSVETRSVEWCASPMPMSAIEAAIGLQPEGDLREILQELFGDKEERPCFSRHGYAAPALGTMYARVAGELDIASCDLGGERNADLADPPPGLADIVSTRLFSILLESAYLLIERLATVSPSSPSAWRGGDAYWTETRAWVASLPLLDTFRKAMDEYPLKLADWKYEAILDVAVTDASTAFLNSPGLASTMVEGRRDPRNEILADVWDGTNDGLWDQLISSSLSGCSEFVAPNEMRGFRADGCVLQRARLGSSDASDWSFVDCDLLLADMRNCSNLTSVSFGEGTNWWAAMLPPVTRYTLSRTRSEPGFVEWCASPPWSNPYWTQSWPRPF